MKKCVVLAVLVLGVVAFVGAPAMADNGIESSHDAGLVWLRQPDGHPWL